MHWAKLLDTKVHTLPAQVKSNTVVKQTDLVSASSALSSSIGALI